MTQTVHEYHVLRVENVVHGQTIFFFFFAANYIPS